MKNVTNTITNPIFMGSDSHKRQNHIQTNSKKRSQSVHTQQQFKELLDAEISKI